MLITLITSVLVAGLLLFNEYSHYKRQKNSFRESYIIKQKEYIKQITQNELRSIRIDKAIVENKVREELKQIVEQAENLAVELYRKNVGVLSDVELKEYITKIIESFQSVDGFSEIYVTSLDGKGIAYYNHHKFKGENLLYLQDDDGNYVVQKELELLKLQDEGFIHYQKNADITTSREKFAYVKKSTLFNWYFSSDIYLDHFYDTLKQEISQRIANYRLPNGGYVFLNELDGTPLVYDGKVYVGDFKFLDGSDALKDSVFRMEISAARSSDEGGYFYYNWPKMDDTLAIPKCSYAVQYPYWNWLIGSGFYLDDADVEIVKHFSDYRTEFIQNLTRLFLLLSFIILIEVIILNAFNKKYLADFNRFFHYFKNSDVTKKQLNVAKFNFEEFRDAAIAANAMVASKEKMYNDLVIQEEKAKESDRLKSAFLANMSHEIRTPMNAIIGFAELLTFDGFSDAERMEHVQLIQSNGDKLLDLINDIIDLSKIEANQLEIKFREFNLKEFIEHSFQRNNAILMKLFDKEIDFILEDKIPEEFMLESDPVRLNQIVDNLLSNAFKFTEKGVIQLSAEILPNAIQISVSDTGLGISENDILRIFERFQQVDNVMYRTHGGTGLGLAITKSLVSMLNGQIKVYSLLGEGTNFVLQLPLISQEQ
ncbi:MAG: cache domain-containing protein [Prolixibacteraceae bacterium]